MEVDGIQAAGRAGRVAAVVLAAGLSSRMGELKCLLPIESQTFLSRVLNTLNDAGIRSAVVVTGHRADEVRSAALAHAGATVAHNANFADGGMLSSVKVGVGALPDDCGAFLVALADHPLVNAGAIRQLVDAWRSRPGAIARPTFNGKHGHPILIDARHRRSILSLGTNDTLKTFIEAHARLAVDVNVSDEGVLVDIDTPADYREATRRVAEAQFRPHEMEAPPLATGA